jgi:predicted NAD/FAD-binding protein
MKIAIIGTGIAGMVAAYLLNDEHDITVFEANDYVGGHTNTVPVETNNGAYAVDTGFIVYNDWTYPNFVTLLQKLKVDSQPSTMSFSVTCAQSGLEYNGTSLNTLFAQRRNLVRPSFLRMVLDILRFNRAAPRLLHGEAETTSLGDYLRTHSYSQYFTEHYIVPMGAAIWSADPQQIWSMPAQFFIRFFHNHGMLSINRRPQWRVIKGGSQQYVQALTKSYRQRIRLRCPVQAVTRHRDHVTVKPAGGEPEHFDQIVIAAHSDQALALLTDPSEDEHALLGALPYQTNDVVLHTDTSLLPRTPRAWASWNYYRPGECRDHVTMTYNMNMLQSLQSQQTFCVTLNRTAAIQPDTILRTMIYHHPVYTAAGVAAQKQHARINGVNRTYFCGAYWGNGFHEDGVNSALTVAQCFGKGLA